MVRRFLAAAGVLCALAAASPALADCQLNPIAQFHIDPKAANREHAIVFSYLGGAVFAIPAAKPPSPAPAKPAP